MRRNDIDSEIRRNDIDFERYDSDDISLSYNREKGIRTQLEERLKKSPLGGYTKPSVEQYAMEVSESMSHMRENFEKQIRTLSAECSKLNSERDVLRSQIRQAEEENESIQSSLRAARQEKQELAAQIQDLQSTTSVSEEYQDEIQNLQCQIEEKDTQVAAYEEQISHLQEELQSARKQIEALNEEIDAVRTQMAEMEQRRQDTAGYAVLYEELEKEKKVNTELHQQNAALRQQIEENQDLQEEMSKANMQLSVREKEKEDLLLKISQMEQSQELALQEAKEGLLLKISKMEQSQELALQEAKEDAEKVKKNADMMEQKYGQLYEQYTLQLGRIEQLKAEKGAIEQLLQKYQMKEQEMAVVQEENTELKAAVAELEQISQEMLKEMERQQNTYEQLLATLREKNTVINDLNAQKIILQMRNVHIMEKMAEVAKGQTPSQDEPVFSEKSSDADAEDKTDTEDGADSEDVIVLPSRVNNVINVDMNRTKSLLNRAKEIGSSYAE